jgi:heptosyltransferase-3
MLHLSKSPRILLSRTDAIGDVVLSLPMAGMIRAKYPDAVIGVLARAYTKDVIACCDAVDEFVLLDDFLQAKHLNWDVIVHVFPVSAIAKKAAALKIPYRIGTSSRLYHWLSCNRLVRLSRKNSELHESQLNTKLLQPLGIREALSTDALGRLLSFRPVAAPPPEIEALRVPGKKSVILHPRSQGSAREWGLEQFSGLIDLLPKDRFQIFISGTKAEGEMLRNWIDGLGDSVTDLTGRLNLGEFISFIGNSYALVAASTGPLHLAASLGIKAIGIYPLLRPMHAGRWGPVGAQAFALSATKTCEDCRRSPAKCDCMASVRPESVAELLK